MEQDALLETQTTDEMIDEELQGDTVENESGHETQGETVEQKEPELPDDVKEKLAQLDELSKKVDRVSGRLGEEKGQRLLLAKLVKKQIDDGLIDEEDAKAATGYDLKRLQSIINAPELADNPFEAQKNEFNKAYGTLKASFDRIYGDDTQKYVDAFVKLGDPTIGAQFIETPTAELPAFVIETGKKLLEKFNGKSKDDYIAELEAKLAAAQTGEPVEAPAPIKAPVLAGATQQTTAFTPSPKLRAIF